MDDEGRLRRQVRSVVPVQAFASSGDMPTSSAPSLLRRDIQASAGPSEEHTAAADDGQEFRHAAIPLVSMDCMRRAPACSVANTTFDDAGPEPT
jgi:hypothetical protein